MTNISHLDAYPLFAGLGEAELACLAGCLSRRSFARGAYLFYPGNPALNIYLVETGLVRLFYADASGREFLLDLAGPCTTVGMPMFRADQTRVAGAIALLPSVVLVLSQQDLTYYGPLYPRLMHNIYHEMDNGLRRLMAYARVLATLSMNGRLATLLLYLSRCDKSQAPQDAFELLLSQADMAGWCGVSRGHLNRAMARFQQQGLIHLEGQKLTILDRPGLQRLTDELIPDQV